MDNEIDFYNILKTIVVSGGLILQELRGKVENKPKKSDLPQNKTKKTTTAHTIIDNLIQEVALEILYPYLPNITINAEETTKRLTLFEQGNQNLCFHLDPLDGTYAYIKGYDGFAVGAGFSKDLEFFTSAIYFPALDKFYYAEKGNGIIVQNGMGTNLEFERFEKPKNCFVQKRCKHLLPITKKMDLEPFDSMCAHYTMTALAEGKLKLQLYHEASPHDFGIPKVLLEEAGGVCTDLKGNDIYFPEDFSRLPYFLAFYSEEVKDEFFSLYSEFNI